MFTKTPTTVAEAVAPFKAVQTNLGLVVKKALATRQEARRQIVTAERAERLAGDEIAQAEKIQKALASIVGDG